MNTYKVRWETSKGGGATWHKGIETVKAESREQAEDVAQFDVWRRGFQEFNRDHVIIIGVSND